MYKGCSDGWIRLAETIRRSVTAKVVGGGSGSVILPTSAIDRYVICLVGVTVRSHEHKYPFLFAWNMCPFTGDLQLPSYVPQVQISSPLSAEKRRNGATVRRTNFFLGGEQYPNILYTIFRTP